MFDWKTYLETGIIERYLLGEANEEECAFLEQKRREIPEVEREFWAVAEAIEAVAQHHAVEPDPILKPFIVATLDYMDRLENGEQPEEPPLLHENSTPEEYAQWLNRPEFANPAKVSGVLARIIGHTPTCITAIVWIEKMAPTEVHDHEFEKFLILEGSCEIQVEDQFYALHPGDQFTIPLHKHHIVHVTSHTPCKVILQRVAAWKWFIHLVFKKNFVF